jgi:hypothetical protein
MSARKPAWLQTNRPKPRRATDRRQRAKIRKAQGR